jgi:hypothetical protein
LEFRDPAYASPDQVPSALPVLVRCMVLSIRYEMEPFLHCVIELQISHNQLKLSELMNACIPVDQIERIRQLDESSALLLNQIRERKLVVHYHPTDLPDFLVLSSRFREALSRPWTQGQKYFSSG